MVSILLLAIIIIGIHPTTSYANEENIQLYAQSAILMDGESGRVLYSKDGDEPMANASTTKILTCIVALENGNMDDVARASKEAAAQPSVHLGVKEGEEYYLLDMLYALMLESYNDAAVIIAEHIGGSVESYMELMNEKAKEIGCEDTYFITPNGLDATQEYETHHSTAEDLALILRYAILESPFKEDFLKITQTPSYSFTELSGSNSYTCTNRNELLTSMSGAISGKTGFTNKAGYCYVGAVEDEGRTFIVAVLASGWPGNKTYRWSDCKALLNYGMEWYHYREIESLPNNGDYTSMVSGGKTEDHTMAYTMSTNISQSAPKKVLMREDEEVETLVEYLTYMHAPVQEGDVIGSVRYLIGEDIWKWDTVTANETIEEADALWNLRRWWSARWVRD